MERPVKSHARKSIRASHKPRDLLENSPQLARTWTAHIVTLLPEAFPGILAESLTGKALRDGLWQLSMTALRDFGEGKHKKVDDTPAGGGAGLVMRADILGAALEDAIQKAPAGAPLIYLSPRGQPLTQRFAQTLAQGPGAILLCGRFEGIDERVLEHYGVSEVSLGDFVLTGGELAAMALIDATVRLIPRVLGNAASLEEESFSAGLLEHPQYTKPAIWCGREIPEVLRSGNHAHIARWRNDRAERLTKERRPDLWRAFCAAHNRDPNEDTEL